MPNVQLETVPPLSVKAIEAARPADKDYELRDPGAPGLRLRITRKGTKVFRWYVTALGRVITIGKWSKAPRPGYVTLAEAHGWLERLRLAYQEGRLGAAEAELAASRRSRCLIDAAPPGDGTVTVRQVAEEFRKFLYRERKRPEQGWRPMEYDILPAIGSRSIGTVTPQDCRAIVEAVVARGSTVQAGAVLAIMKQFFNFAVDRADLDSSPAERFRNPRALGVEKNISQRFLTEEEIAAFWGVLSRPSGITPTVRSALRLLLLLGMRSGELLQARWEQVDFNAATLTIPVAHQKLTRRRERTARAWLVPLGPTSLALLHELRALAASLASPFVLASIHTPGVAVTEKSLNHAMRRLFTGPTPALSFQGERPTPHDLRRTMRTHLGDKLGVPWHVAERCLNHSLGQITATYDVGDYVKERRAAIERWDAHVVSLVSPHATVAVLPVAAGR